MTDYVSEAEHHEMFDSCVGHRLVEISHSSWGEVTLRFDHGVEIEFGDGWCFTTNGKVTGCGAIYTNERVRGDA